MEGILLLVWVFLTLFSFFGGVGLDELFPVFNTGYAGLILALNFYISNFLAYILGGALGKLNLLLILLGTALLLFGFEIYGTYYLFWEILDLNTGFWSVSFFIFTLIFILGYGGIRQILILFISIIQNGFNFALDRMSQNAFDSAFGRIKSKNINSNKPKSRNLKN